MGGGRIDALDGLRAIAVSMVIVSHLAVDSSLGSGYSDDRYWDPIVQLGQFGVYGFFILSGFVITRGLRVEDCRNGRVSIAGFFVRRAFRILPALALYLLCLKALDLLGVLDQPASGLLDAALFTCNLGQFTLLEHCRGTWLGHLWSLAYEEQFYLFFPFLFIAALKGGVLGRVAVAGVLALAVVATRMRTGEIVFPLRGFLLIGMGVAAACYEAEIRRLIAGARPVEMIGIALSWAPLVAVGRMSYGLYLWQQLVTRPHPGAGYGIYALALVALFLWCWLLFRYFEQPLIRLGARLSRQWSAPRAVSQPAE